MQAVAPRAARTQDLHRAGGRFRVTVVHARLRALDTAAGVHGRPGSLCRAALVMMSLQELAYQLLTPPVQFPFEFALAHLSGFAGGEEGFGIREDSIGRRAPRDRRGGGRFAALARRLYVLGILSPQPSTTTSAPDSEEALRKSVFIIVVLLALFAVSTAAAQPPTVPPTIDVTCHGYDEGATRAYNCIPVASQQSLLGTFVPPVGSECNGGRIAEFPPGRIVFQIRCNDGPGGTTPTGPWSRSGLGSETDIQKPDGIRRIRVVSRFTGFSTSFRVYCQDIAGSSYYGVTIVNELVGSSYGNQGTDGIYGVANCLGPHFWVRTGDSQVEWTLTEDRAQTAISPPRTWEGVTGAGGNLSVEALADLAVVVETERRMERSR